MQKKIVWKIDLEQILDQFIYDKKESDQCLLELIIYLESKEVIVL